MGCNCKGTKKGIPNRADDATYVNIAKTDLEKTIGDLEVDSLNSQQEQKVVEIYYFLYPNSVPVTVKQAYNKLKEL